MSLRLQIISTGVFFVLPTNPSLTIDINSTLFNNQGDFLGSISYPGKMELEPNRAALKNAHYITTNTKLRQLDVMMWFGSLPYKQVIFRFTIENNQVNYTLNIDAAIIANKLKTLTLQDIFDPAGPQQVDFLTFDEVRAYMLATTTATPGTYPAIYFPLKNDGAYNTIDPSQYATYPDIAFPVNPYMNGWKIDLSGAGSFVSEVPGAPVSQTAIPSFCLPYIFRRIATFFGFKTVGHWLDEENSNRIVVASNIPSLSMIQADLTYYMPAVLVSDFLKDMRTELGLLLDFDETRKVMICESITNLITTGNTVDLRDKQLISYRETGTLPDAYTITQGADDKDTAFTDAEKTSLPVLDVGDVSGALVVTSIALTSAATKMLTENSPAEAGAVTWRVPWIKQPVNGTTPMDQISSLAYADRAAFKVRLLYYHGLKPNAAGFLYPYASSDNLDFSGAALAAFSLALNAGGTVFLSVRQYFNYVINSKPAEFDFKLTAADVSKIQANTRILVHDFNRATVSCLLDQMSFDITNDELYMSKLTLYPRILPDNLQQIIPVVPIVPPPPPFDNGLVYVRLVRSFEYTTFASPIPPHYVTFMHDYTAYFFSDAAGTIPKLVIHALPVRFQQQQFNDTFLFSTDVRTINCDTAGGTAPLYPNAPTDSNQGAHNYVWTYSILPSAHYTVIP